jgi:hypothetical protein
MFCAGESQDSDRATTLFRWCGGGSVRRSQVYTGGAIRLFLGLRPSLSELGAAFCTRGSARKKTAAGFCPRSRPLAHFYNRTGQEQTLDDNNQTQIRMAKRDLVMAVEQRRRLSTLTDAELACAGLRSRLAAEEWLDGAIARAQTRLAELWQ